MNIIEAEKIINKYGVALEKGSSMPPVGAGFFAMSESLLPYSKDKIKVAIKTYVAYLARLGGIEKEIGENLESSFSMLGKFVSDDKVEIAKEGFKVMKGVVQPSNERKNAILARLREVQDFTDKEYLAYRQEFIDYYSSLKTPSDERGPINLNSPRNLLKQFNNLLLVGAIFPFKLFEKMTEGKTVFGTSIKFDVVHGMSHSSVSYFSDIENFMPTCPDYIALFSFYYAKTLFNLGKISEAEMLFEQVQEISTADWRERKSEIVRYIDESEKSFDKPKLLNSLPFLKREYLGKLKGSADLVTKRRIVTNFSMGAENYFLPVSVLVLLKDIIGQFSNAELVSLYICIQGMHSFYSENSYDQISSILAAPKCGLAESFT